MGCGIQALLLKAITGVDPRRSNRHQQFRCPGLGVRMIRPDEFAIADRDCFHQILRLCRTPGNGCCPV